MSAATPGGRPAHTRAAFFAFFRDLHPTPRPTDDLMQETSAAAPAPAGRGGGVMPAGVSSGEFLMSVWEDC